MLMNPLVLQPKRLEAVVFGLVEDSQVYAGFGWLTETCGSRHELLQLLNFKTLQVKRIFLATSTM